MTEVRSCLEGAVAFAADIAEPDKAGAAQYVGPPARSLPA